MKYALGSCTLLALLYILCAVYWTKPNIDLQWASVYNAELSEISLELLSHERKPTQKLPVGAPFPCFVTVKGNVTGPTPADFKKFAWLGNLFWVQLVDGEDIQWLSQPGKIEVSSDGGFSFDVPIMISKSSSIGRKELICIYRGSNAVVVARRYIDVVDDILPKF